MKFANATYTISFSKNGAIRSLKHKKHENIEWIAKNAAFGRIFVQGTQNEETYLSGELTHTEHSFRFVSDAKRSSIEFCMEEEYLSFHAELPQFVGPRVGIDFSLNFLDTPGDNWEDQCMPHVIYTDDDHRYFYIIFYSPKGKYLTLIVDSKFSAWRIKYSEQGHKMVGFQVLSEVDDLVNQRPILCDKLSGKFFFSDTLEAAYDFIANQMGFSIFSLEVYGSFQGNTLPVSYHGNTYPLKVISPSGKEKVYQHLSALSLEEVGFYQLISMGKNYSHQTVVCSMRPWDDLLKLSADFYRKHFQDQSGAFYRVIWSDTLSPEQGVTYEGIAFGDPNKLISCKTGEFGGFAGWLNIKEALHTNNHQEARAAAKEYIEKWALNLDGNPPHPGTITTAAQVFGNREYGPYHIYHDFNYPQYEIFLIEQLVDYYQLTHKELIREYAINIGKHFINEHFDSELGYVWCMNKDTSAKHDYSTVHTPITGLVKLAQICPASKERSAFMLAAEKLADYIVKRGLNFPTEGEQSTEDGSMACSALSLFYAYKFISKKADYLTVGKLILEKHQVLELNGTDARLNHSSLRFWETMYETRDWGPSINAGHAWSLWSAEAKLLLAELSNDFQLLKEAYSSFVSAVTKIDSNGGIRCCFTPDIIPGTPHKYDLYLEDRIESGKFYDLFETSIPYARDFPKKTYSTSGTYVLIKAYEYWNRLAGLSFNEEIVLNGVETNGGYSFDLDNSCTLIIQGKTTRQIQIYFPEKVKEATLLLDTDEALILSVSGCSFEYTNHRCLLTNINRKVGITIK